VEAGKETRPNRVFSVINRPLLRARSCVIGVGPCTLGALVALSLARVGDVGPKRATPLTKISALEPV
jgi:hypothetical protein